MLIGVFVYYQVHPTAEFPRNYWGVFQLAIPIAFLTAGWRWLRYPRTGTEQTPPDFNSSLVESVAQARSSLPYFLEQVQRNVDRAFIKFPLKAQQRFTKDIWAYVHSYRDGKFSVSLADTPVGPTEPQDVRRDIPEEEVEDWQLRQPDGRIKGAHSMLVLFRYMENHGEKLTPEMQKLKTHLLDAAK